MRFQAVTLTFSTLLLIACGADVSPNRKGAPANETNLLSGGDGTKALTIPSGMFREKASDILYYAQEGKFSDSGPAEYRSIPRMEIDDEGSNGTSVRARSALGRPEMECGLSLNASFDERIKECANLNGVKATWSGVKYGNSTEGRWDLVALKKLNSKNVEIWVDRKTGMVWSDVQAPTNWCEASGNDQSEVADLIKIDCQKLKKNSVCTDKLILGLKGFRWRLPTRNDYLQADLDGIRFVLQRGNGQGFWTATLDSASLLRENAWVYNSDQSGQLASEQLTKALESRCIGAVISQ